MTPREICLGTDWCGPHPEGRCHHFDLYPEPEYVRGYLHSKGLLACPHYDCDH
jgi:hypothetical protein